MTFALMLFGVGVVALAFAGYFFFGSDRIANRNVLNRRMELPARLRRRATSRPDPLEELLNRVYIIDERLVRMKAAMAIILLVAGFFLVLVSVTLLR